MLGTGHVRWPRGGWEIWTGPFARLMAGPSGWRMPVIPQAAPCWSTMALRTRGLISGPRDVAGRNSWSQAADGAGGSRWISKRSVDAERQPNVFTGDIDCSVSIRGGHHGRSRRAFAGHPWGSV